MPFSEKKVGNIIKNTFVFGWIILPIFLQTACRESGSEQVKPEADPDIAGITKEIESQPEEASLYYLRAQKYYEKQRFQEAILDMEKAMSIDSLNPDYYHLMSDVYLDYYNSSGALKMMNRALALYPERVPSLLKMSELKYILEDYDGSILTVNEIVRLDPQNAEAYFMLGRNFMALQDQNRAIQAFQRAVELNSQLTDAWLYLGELYESRKDPLALTYYESAVLSDPKSNEALHAKAYYLQNHGKVNEALQLYKQIVLRDKAYTDAYLNQGLLYLDMDSLNQALSQFDLMTANAPTNYLGFYYRGVVHQKKGNKKAAINDYESAYRLNGKDEKAQKALQSLKGK
jgi:tetratricopeptide (TPR) repeat protein